MAAKRLRKRKPGSKPWILQEPDAPEIQPQKVTCPGCGATAELTDHTCPECGQLFYERPHGKKGHKASGKPPSNEPEIADFSRRMDELEQWTRVVCVILGVVFGFLAVLCLAALTRGFFRVGLCGTFLFGLLSILCLLRGLGRKDADTDFVSSLPGFRSFWRR